MERGNLQKEAKKPNGFADLEKNIPRDASAMKRGDLQEKAKITKRFAHLEKGRFLSVIILRHGRGSQLAGKRSNGPENLDTSHTYAVPPLSWAPGERPGARKTNGRDLSVLCGRGFNLSAPRVHRTRTTRPRRGPRGPAPVFRAPYLSPDPGSGLDTWSTLPSIEVINDRKSGPIVLNLGKTQTVRISVTADSSFRE